MTHNCSMELTIPGNKNISLELNLNLALSSELAVPNPVCKLRSEAGIMEPSISEGIKRLLPGDFEDYDRLPPLRRKPYHEQGNIYARTTAYLQPTNDTLSASHSPFSDCFNITSSSECLTAITSPFPSTCGSDEVDEDICLKSSPFPSSGMSDCWWLDPVESTTLDTYIEILYDPERDARMSDGSGFAQTLPVGKASTGGGLDIATRDNHPQETKELAELCFGMICGARASFFDKAPISDLATAKFSILRQTENCFILTSPAQLQLGVIDVRTAKTLSDIFGFDTIRCEASFPKGYKIEKNPHELREKPGDPITINVYGSRDILSEVGKRLSDAKVYLQQPDHLDESIVYENPHYFNFSGQPTPIIRIDPATTERPNLNNEIATVFDSLDQAVCLQLSELPIDIRIKTDLLRHQKEGVSFIAGREDNPGAGKLSLWQLDNSNGRRFYRHIITGSRRALPPQECRGGILADDMGLGKTLTTLSSIVRSLENANVFAQNLSNQQDPTSNESISGKIASKTTLIIVPLSLLDGWAEEIEKHIVPGTLSYYRYHGGKRETNPTKLRNFDIILTTYATVAYDHSTDISPLEKLHFYRLVLDEAHIIRSRSTNQFRAVFSLSAEHRWCLTGTPVQNKLEDIESLIKLLRLSPFDDRNTFKKSIVEPLKAGNVDGLKNLRTLLGSICLRRTQAILTTLPESTEKPRMLELSPEERERYQEVTEKSKDAIEDVICNGNPANTYHKVLQAILQLRLLCNHGTFDISSPGTAISDIDGSSSSTLDLLQQTGEATCAYCYCPIDSLENVESSASGSLTICSHFLCPDCLPRYQNSLKKLPGKKVKFECPLCQSHIGSKYLITAKTRKATKSASSPRSIPDFSLQSGTSTKVSALLSDIEENADDEKSVVFSYWTRTLDLVESVLSSRGIRYVRLDGSLAVAARKTVITTFREDPTVKVLLMTTGTGAVGLNLTVANRVHLLEPQWNPMVDSQAIGRVRRLGQKKPVSIFRYIMRNTIEEAVQSRQLKKLQLAELTCDAGNKEQEGSMTNRILNLRALL